MEKQLHHFSYDESNFLLDDKPIQILCGEIHYQRIPREHWKHRLLMAKSMGLNSVAIYMFWNQHEPKPGEFNFSGQNDVREFIQIAQEVGLWVILRPGPYCCGEWDFGGFPQWLLADGNLRLRCMYDMYIIALDRYIENWAKELVDMQCIKGGPILMVQVENEYGSYGSDKQYLKHIQEKLISVGFEIPKYTCDGSSEYMLNNGTLPDLLCMVNFGNNPKGNFEKLANFRKNIPHMCCEYYPGWFNHWGDRKLVKTHKPRILQIVSDMKWMIENGKSWSLYMFHGGTNFGFSAGANHHHGFQPDITSYDYSAPVGEDGTPNEQYYAYRELLKEYAKTTSNESNTVAFPEIPEIPKIPKHINIPRIDFSQSASIFENIPDPILSGQLHSMEYYGLNNGFINYRTKIRKSYCLKNLIIKELHDYGIVFIDGKKLATFNRLGKKNGEFKVRIPYFKDKVAQLDIFVESSGRINYGSYIIDRKGITDYVSINETPVLMNWEVSLIKPDEKYFSTLKWVDQSSFSAGPCFHKSIFNLKKVGDTFLDCTNWTKGMVWINGHNLGRYWDIGPQKYLYCPGSWLNSGENELILFETEKANSQKKIRRNIKELRKKAPRVQKDSINYERPPIWGLKSKE